MQSVVRKTHRYKFKKPDLESLRKLGKRLKNLGHFRNRYGRLLDILKTDVDEGLINTFIQFYDPVYHCFTFQDYQILPTLEEYSYWVGLPILDEVPFPGLERTPKIPVIAKTFHLELSDMKKGLDTKDGIQGLTFNYLYQKATTFAEKSDASAFETIFALLIYGIVLFPNVDNFVDINAIQIFLTQNPVPTLLADTYYSIHERIDKKRGVILCCTSLLHTWITSHLPCPKIGEECRPWSEKIMNLTPNDIDWYNPAYDTGVIIDHCGDFNNVPLLGRQGGISLNPIMARRQFRYPMKMKPLYIFLSSEFFSYEKDAKNLKDQFVKAWSSIVKLDRNQLRSKSRWTQEPYVQWVINRANKLGMPYSLQRHATATVPTITLPLPSRSLEDS